MAQSESRIEQVRELMFGPQLRECSTRIEQLESLVANARDDSQRRFAEVRELVAQEAAGALDASEKKVKALDSRSGEATAELRTRLEGLEDRTRARFQTLEEGLASLQEDLRKRLEAMQESVSSSVRTSVESLEKRIQALGAELQNQSADLRRQGTRTDEKLENRVRTLGEEIESGATRLRSELGQAQKGLLESVQGVESRLASELRKQFNEVRYSKVSKDEISDILVEFGMRLKGMDASSVRMLSFEEQEKNG
ncbi:MAG: hypothetical protein ACREQJ_13485 [Candidatus Binatia bacterium]